MRLSFTQSIIECNIECCYRCLVLHNLSFVSLLECWSVNHILLETIPYICTYVPKSYLVLFNWHISLNVHRFCPAVIELFSLNVKQFVVTAQKGDDVTEYVLLTFVGGLYNLVLCIRELG